MLPLAAGSRAGILRRRIRAAWPLPPHRHAWRQGERGDRRRGRRPAVEAGEKLGFLPGDLQSKVDPYLRPLYDALQEFFGMENYLKLIERQAIEIAPLAYMRGRTLDEAFIILDEAQNTTDRQMNK